MRRRRFRCSRWHCVIGIVGALALLAPEAGVSAQQAAGSVAIYTGTANLTFHATPLLLHPLQPAPYIDTTVVRIRFTVQDDAHYQISLQTIRPALDAGRETLVMNGGTLGVYDARSNTAVEYTLPPSQFERYFLQFMSGNGGVPGQGGALPDPAKPFARYLAALRSDASRGLQRLQYREDVRASSEDKPGSVDHLLYRVTALSIRQRPPGTRFQFAPPVPVSLRATTVSTSTWPGDYSEMPPSPFLALPDPSGMNVACGNWEADTGIADPSPVLLESLFTTDRSLAGCGNPVMPGSYVFVLQRVQVNGLPAGLEHGTPIMAGSCTIWSGVYASGVVWTAFARDGLAIFTAAIDLLPEQLVRYTRQLCTAPIATGPDSPTDGVPANDWTCVTHGPRQWSMTIYHYPQHNQSCDRTISEAVDHLPLSVRSIAPPGVSVDTSTCAITWSGKAPPGSVAFVRCSFPDGSSGSNLRYDLATITDGPDPVRSS